MSDPAVERETVVRRYRTHLSEATAKAAEATAMPVEVRSEGVRVWDSTGRSYLDCGGYGVFTLGHRHPAVVGAVRAQLDRHPMASRAMLCPEQAAAAEALAAVAPAGLDRVCFASTGAEAVEIAIKLARANNRRRLVAFRGGFHGKTLGALSITDRPIFQRPFRPLFDAALVPFDDLDAAEAALAGSDEPACVVVEPVQCEGGVHVPAPGYLAGLAERCRAHGALLVVDEIQTGLGRLGTWWGCDAEGVRPDVLVTGKALGGGCVPVSAVVATEEVFTPFNRHAKIHSSTFAGSPLVSAAVRATLAVMRDEDIPARAARLGRRLRPALEAAADGTEAVRAVRGRGLMIGLDLGHPTVAGKVFTALLDRGVIACHALGADAVVRLAPPAIMTDGEIDLVAEATRDALGAVDGPGAAVAAGATRAPTGGTPS